MSAFPSLLQSAENERRLQLMYRTVPEHNPLGALSNDQVLERIGQSIRTVLDRWKTESEQEYNQRMDEREQDRYDMQEAQ